MTTTETVLAALASGAAGVAAAAMILANRLGGAAIGAGLALAVLWPSGWRDGISRAVVSIGAGWAFGPIALELVQDLGISSATQTTGQIIAGFLGYPLAGVIYRTAPKVLKGVANKRLG